MTRLYAVLEGTDRDRLIERLRARLEQSSRVAHVALHHDGTWAACVKKRCQQDRAALEAVR